jgi:hypothetical protein
MSTVAPTNPVQQPLPPQVSTRPLRPSVQVQRPDAGGQDLAGARQSFMQAQQGFNQSPQSFDNAAARVRNRVQGQTTGQGQQIRDQFAGRGMSNSGLMRNELARNQQAGQGAYAQGLADLENTFEQSRLQSAQGLAGIGQQMGALGMGQQGQADQFALGAGNLGLGERGQDVQGQLGQDQIQRDILGTLLQFGNAQLGGGSNDWRNEIYRYFMGNFPGQ